MATAASPVNRTINIYINQAAAQKSLDALNLKAEKLQESIKRGEAAGRDMSRQITQLGNTKSKISELENVISGKFAPSLSMARNQVKALERELNNMSSSAPGYAAKLVEFEKARDSFKRLQAEVHGTGAALEQTFGKNRTFWDRVKEFTAGGFLAGMLQKGAQLLYRAGEFTVAGNAKLSDSLSDVRKATGLTTAEVNELSDALDKIDTRTKAEDLLAIATGLGQIGEAASEENVAKMDKIVVALGDEFGGDAQGITTTLGILWNNLQDIKSGNYGDDVLHIANALNVLGAEGLATAPVVVDFATRMSGVLGTFNASSGQILGLSAAMQEMGINAERGSTAMVKLLQKMASEQDKFAKVIQFSGGSVKEFKKLIDTDIVAAFQMFAEAAKKAGQSNSSFAAILKEVDADGAGAGEALSKIAQNADLVNDKIRLATEALTNGTSITEEFNTKNNNLAATLEKIGKRFSSYLLNSSMMTGLTAIVSKFGEWIGVIDSAERALQELTSQTEELNGIEGRITPLLEEYENLKTNTELSAEEQNELKNVIEQISKLVPNAATAFDQYGRAIDISTKSARNYLKLKRLLLEEENQDQIQDTQKQILDTRSQLEAEQGRLERARKQADMWLQRGEKHLLYDSNKLMEETKRRIDELQTKITNAYSRLNLLRGLPIDGDQERSTLEIPLPKGVSLADYNATGKQKPAPVGGGFAPAVKNAESALKRLEALKQEILKINREVAAAQRGEDDKELQRIVERYMEVRRKVEALPKQLQATLSGLMTTFSQSEQREIELLLKKQFKERSEKEYTESLQAASDYYNKERTLAGESYLKGETYKQAYTARLLELDRLESEARSQIAQDYAATSEKAAKDVEDNKTKAVEKGVRERVATEKLEAAKRLDVLNYNLLTSRKFSEGELSARIALINEQYAQEIAAAAGNAERIKLLERQRDQEIYQAKTQHVADVLNLYLQQAQQIMGALDQYVSFVNQRERDLLDQERARNDERKRSWQEMLDNKRITKAQFDKNVAKADEELRKKEHEAKVKEFKRNKAAQLANAAINLAMTVSSIWANWGAMPVVAAALAIAGAAVQAVQIGMIAKQSAPAYEKGRRPEGSGGIAEGPSHGNNGIKLVDGQTGEVVGEMEGGEGIFSKRTMENNPELTNALIDSSMNHGGRRIDWFYSSPALINYRRATSAITTSSYRSTYSGGGSDPRYHSNSPEPSNQQVLDMYHRVMERLEKPAVVVWKDIQEKNLEYERLSKGGSFNG